MEAFVVLIVIPLALAWALQAWAARRPAGQKVADAATTTMVPLMAATLLTVVASQIPEPDDSLTDVAAVIPCYAVFLIVMAFAGKAVARLFRLDVPGSRAVVFTGATRNSLVVLPLALALPARTPSPPWSWSPRPSSRSSAWSSTSARCPASSPTRHR